ncbi:hypothetical protein D9758_013831 [Tetrapyrgos nigripes]|uniref:Uncharacterized protein n=1 Tax=Tetrapyrgos nigripes TaxID=182062 RepID=A0A8H5CVK4_9AGAR|nr:hypothetical protein D9758_013831 [Tetrapyrgos nigripes]
MPPSTRHTPRSDTSRQDAGSRKKKKDKKSRHKSTKKHARDAPEAHELFNGDDTLLDANSNAVESSPEELDTTTAVSKRKKKGADNTPVAPKRKRGQNQSGARKKQRSTTPEPVEDNSDDSDAEPIEKSAKRAGRWYARRGDVWINPFDAIIAGLQASQDATEGEGSAARPARKKKPSPTQVRCLEIYQRFMEDNDPNFADLRKLFVTGGGDEEGDAGRTEAGNGDGDEVNIEAIKVYTKKMQFHASRVRSDDTGKLKRDTDKLLADPSSRRVKVFSKSSMGWYDKVTACLLCPVDELEVFDQDPEEYMDNVLNGTSSKHWSEWAMFLYDENLMDDDNPAAGLFKAPLLVHIFNHIYDSTGIKNNGAKTKSSVSRLHGMTEVAAEDIAYTSVQTRFLLSSQSTCSRLDHGFNIKEFYWSIIRFFRNNRRGSRTILKWWNKEVFHGAGGIKQMTLSPLKNSRFSRLMEEADPSESESESGSGSKSTPAGNVNQGEGTETNDTKPPSSHTSTPALIIEVDGDVTRHGPRGDSPDGGYESS